MDLLRIIARHAFYAAWAPFKKAYNNYRALPAGRQATTITSVT